MNRNLTEEENSSQCLKKLILTQITIEDENGLAEREVFPKTINERIQFDNYNKLTLRSFFAFCSVFSQGQTEERWKRLLDRHRVRFQKYSVRNLQYGPKTRLTRGTYLKRGNTPEKISNIALMPFFSFLPVRITSPTLATYPKPVREITILKLRLKVSRASLVYLRQGNLMTKQYTK